MAKIEQVLDRSGNPKETTITEASQHSIDVGRNAKGDFTFGCKLYFEDPDNTGMVDKAYALYGRFIELFEPEKVRAFKLELERNDD